MFKVIRESVLLEKTGIVYHVCRNARKFELQSGDSGFKAPLCDADFPKFRFISKVQKGKQSLYRVCNSASNIPDCGGIYFRFFFFTFPIYGFSRCVCTQTVRKIQEVLAGGIGLFSFCLQPSLSLSPHLFSFLLLFFELLSGNWFLRGWVCKERGDHHRLCVHPES